MECPLSLKNSRQLRGTNDSSVLFSAVRDDGRLGRLRVDTDQSFDGLGGLPEADTKRGLLFYALLWLSYQAF